jgi:hypothetical protein
MGTARCFVSSHLISIEGWLGVLRFDRANTTITVGKGHVSRHLELANPEITVRVFPSVWKSADQLLRIHAWLSETTPAEGA